MTGIVDVEPRCADKQTHTYAYRTYSFLFFSFFFIFFMILKQISLPCEHTRMHRKNPFQARDQSGSSGLRRAQRRDKSRAEGCGCLRRGAQPARKCDTAQSIFVNLSLTLGGRWHPPTHTQPPPKNTVQKEIHFFRVKSRGTATDDNSLCACATTYESIYTERKSVLWHLPQHHKVMRRSVETTLAVIPSPAA